MGFRLGQIYGVDIRLHWSVILVLLIVQGFRQQIPGVPGLGWVGVPILGLICLTTREIAHALVATSVGVRILSIELLPWGASVQTDRVPRHALKEIAVACAGPTANLVFMVMTGGVLLWGSVVKSLGGGQPLSEPVWLIPVLAILSAINAFLALFNLLPAFPLEGGRIVRAILSLFMSYLWATRIAATIGQLMMLAVAGYSLFHGLWFLLLVSLFLFFRARMEVSLIKAEDELSDGLRHFLNEVPENEWPDEVRAFFARTGQRPPAKPATKPKTQNKDQEFQLESTVER